MVRAVCADEGGGLCAEGCEILPDSERVLCAGATDEWKKCARAVTPPKLQCAKKSVKGMGKCACAMAPPKLQCTSKRVRGNMQPNSTKAKVCIHTVMR